MKKTEKKKKEKPEETLTKRGGQSWSSWMQQKLRRQEQEGN